MEGIEDRKCWLGKHKRFRSRRSLGLGKHIDLNCSPKFLELGMEDIEDRKFQLGKYKRFRSSWSLELGKDIDCCLNPIFLGVGMEYIVGRKFLEGRRKRFRSKQMELHNHICCSTIFLGMGRVRS